MTDRYVVRDRVAFALYVMAVEQPDRFAEAEHFTAGMLANDHAAFDRVMALLESVK